MVDDQCCDFPTPHQHATRCGKCDSPLTGQVFCRHTDPTTGSFGTWVAPVEPDADERRDRYRTAAYKAVERGDDPADACRDVADAEISRLQEENTRLRAELREVREEYAGYRDEAGRLFRFLTNDPDGARLLAQFHADYLAGDDSRERRDFPGELAKAQTVLLELWLRVADAGSLIARSWVEGALEGDIRFLHAAPRSNEYQIPDHIRALIAQYRAKHATPDSPRPPAPSTRKDPTA